MDRTAGRRWPGDGGRATVAGAQAASLRAYAAVVRPIAVYSALRLGIFLAAFLLFALLGARPLLAVVLAAVVSLLLSFVVLRRQRDEVTGVFARQQTRRHERRRDRSATGGFLSGRLAADAAAEDAEADAAAGAGTAGPRPRSRGSDGDAPGAGQ